MNSILELVWRNSIVGIVFILVIFGLRHLTRNYSKIYVRVLWLMLLVELLVPPFIQSPIYTLRDFGMEAKMSNTLSIQNVDLPQAEAKNNSNPEGKNEQTQLKNEQTQINGKEEGLDNSVLVPVNSVSVSSKNQNALSTVSEQNQINKTVNYTISKVKISPLLLVWIVGMLLVAGYYLLQFVRLKKQMATAIRIEKNVWESEHTKMPFVMPGIVCNIYLPFGLEEEARKNVLAHERQHIRQFDPWMKCLAMLTTIVHWFNPFVWFAFLFIGKDIELYCDEQVMKGKTFEEKKSYSQHLLDFSLKANGFAPILHFGESDTRSRVKHVLYRKKMKPALVLILCILLSGCGTSFLAVSRNNIIYTGKSDDNSLSGVDAASQKKEQEDIDNTEVQDSLEKEDVAESLLSISQQERLVMQVGEQVLVINRYGETTDRFEKARICSDYGSEVYADVLVIHEDEPLRLMIYTGKGESYLEGYQAGLYSVAEHKWWIEPSYDRLNLLSENVCTDSEQLIAIGKLMDWKGNVIETPEDSLFVRKGDYICDYSHVYDLYGNLLASYEGEIIVEIFEDKVMMYDCVNYEYSIRDLSGNVLWEETNTSEFTRFTYVCAAYMNWLSEDGNSGIITDMNLNVVMTDEEFRQTNPEVDIVGQRIQLVSVNSERTEKLVSMWDGDFWVYYCCDNEFHILESYEKYQAYAWTPMTPGDGWDKNPTKSITDEQGNSQTVAIWSQKTNDVSGGQIVNDEGVAWIRDTMKYVYNDSIVTIEDAAGNVCLEFSVEK